VMELIKPLQKELSAIAELKDKNRPSPLFSHLTMIADGIPALGWVVVTPTPGPYINEMKDAAQFYANRVIKESKDKDPVNVKWVQSFSAFLVELFGYVKKWHTTGLAWNPRGGDALQASVKSAPSAQSAPAPATDSTPKPVVDLLGGLAKGTSGLRKVEKSEMTHKNPELRATSVVPASSEKPVVAKPNAAKTAPKGPPKLALEGNKWVVV
jgi:adenylyl cyclase-associated protein